MNIIQTTELNKSFRKLNVLKGLNFDVQEGSIYGFLGRNGAGKTTTVKILLGLDRKFKGNVKVINKDPKKVGDQIRLHTGYVPEKPVFPGWMTISRLIRFTSPFYPSWDKQYCNTLLENFCLPHDRKIMHLSRGMVAKVSLVLALAHHPKLLILDDPTMGLDAVVRREFLENMVDLIREGTRTVFFSSHIIDEVERVADSIGVLDKGILQISGKVEDIKANYKSLIAVFPEKPPENLNIPGVSTYTYGGRKVRIEFHGYSQDIEERIYQLGATHVEVVDLSLEDIFVRVTGENRENKNHQQ